MSDLFPFHIRVYARPAAALAESPRKVGSKQVTPLSAPQADLLSTWPITFDEAAQRLAQLPRMFLEPDGCFVWVGGGIPPAQIDGVLYDRGPNLAYLELRGSSDWPTLQRLLRCLGYPETPLVFELVADGLLLAEPDFLAIVAASGPGNRRQ